MQQYIIHGHDGQIICVWLAKMHAQRVFGERVSRLILTIEDISKQEVSIGRSRMVGKVSKNAFLGFRKGAAVTRTWYSINCGSVGRDEVMSAS